MAADIAKDSSTPLIAGLDVTSQDLLIPCITQNKHQDVLEGAQFSEHNYIILSPCPTFTTHLLYFSLVHDTNSAFIFKYHLPYLLACTVWRMGFVKHQIILSTGTSSETLANMGKT